VNEINWQGRRVVIVGAARQGTALAAYLAGKDALVTLSDMRPKEHFAQVQADLSSKNIHWLFGEPDLEILERTDLLCLSGGVSPEIPLVIEAKRRAIPISNDSQIFLDTVPCPVVGITGSAGKTTTTMLVGRMLASMQGESIRKVWVGGNIGNPLISVVDQIQESDLAVLELSSFQLELMNRSPHIAALLNLAPNHLDRHANMADYAAAKAMILDFQNTEDIAVLGREDIGAWTMKERVRGNLWSFGRKAMSENQFGSFIADEHICLRDGQGERRILPISAIELLGDHNVLNVLAATVIAKLAGASDVAIASGVEGFTGAPHRLEKVRQLNGVDWYNDSIATSPQRAEASLRSFERPVVLLAGGRDKGLDWESFAATANARAKAVLAFGEAADLVKKEFSTAADNDIEVSLHEDLHSALGAAAEIATNGDVVLLAPGGTSFDEFEDFEERGERFRDWVADLE